MSLKSGNTIAPCGGVHSSFRNGWQGVSSFVPYLLPPALSDQRSKNFPTSLLIARCTSKLDSARSEGGLYKWEEFISCSFGLRGLGRGVFLWVCEWDSSTLRLLEGSQSELVLFIRGDGYRSMYVPCLMRSAAYLFRPLCFLC